MKNLHTRKTSNGSNFGWLIRQMSINQKSGRQTFRRRFVSGSLFVSPCPPECNFQSETKVEPDLRLMERLRRLRKKKEKFFRRQYITWKTACVAEGGGGVRCRKEALTFLFYWRCLEEKKSEVWQKFISNKLIVTLVTQGFPSSFLSRSVA